MLEMERYIVGQSKFPHGKAWKFQCPVCAKLFEYGEPGEPLCTGPSESRDDHPQELMLLVSIRKLDGTERIAPPGLPEERARSPLYVPQ